MKRTCNFPSASGNVLRNADDIYSDESNKSSNEFYNSPEYIPCYEKHDSEFEVSDTDDSLSLKEINSIGTKHNFGSSNVKLSSLNINESKDSSNVETQNNLTEIHHISKNTMSVDRAKKTISDPKKMVKDKRVFCLFCEQLETNFPRHLERKHSLELEVRQFITLPKKSKERLKHIELLKNKGNFIHNRSVLSKNKGSLIVGRRPSLSDEIEANDFLPCKFCFMFCKKKKLYRHMKRCKFQINEETDGLKKRRNNLMQCASLLHTDNDYKQLHSDIFSSMKCDDITLIAQTDDLICSFGARLLKNHRDRHLKNYISQRLRQLSNFLKILRGLEPDIKQLKDCLVPKYYKTIVEAAKKLSGYDEQKNTYTFPSNALKIGHSILQCSDILESQFIIKGVTELELQNLKNFKQVFQKEWKFSISSNACQDISKKKFNQSMSLPDAKDITLLHNYLSNQLEKVKASIDKGEINQETYKTLCQNLLTQIILLNRRRSGEANRITVKDYLKRNTDKMQEEIYKSLTEVEVKLSNSFERFEIRGKKGRAVPVLLTPIMKQSLDLILKIRNSVNVFEDNEYLFAIPFTVVGCYRGSDCLRKAAYECGSASPKLLTSTKLRKHIATMSQLLNLTNNDREQLANFMGHDLSIHNEYYRLPDNTLQVSRVSKILLAMESGKLHELKGKSLEEFDNFMMPSNSAENSSDSEDDKGTVFLFLIINNYNI